MTGQYARVEGGVVVEGPKTLMRSPIKHISNPTDDQLLESSWYSYIAPVIDYATHNLGAIDFVDGELSTQIIELTAQEIADNVAEELQLEKQLMVLTPWQFRKAINAAGKRAIVEAALSSMTQDEQDGWYVASKFERLNPLVIKLAGQLLGFNDNQIDNFFINAAKL